MENVVKISWKKKKEILVTSNAIARNLKGTISLDQINIHLSTDFATSYDGLCLKSLHLYFINAPTLLYDEQRKAYGGHAILVGFEHTDLAV